MRLSRWARKGLRRGDLGTLAELANGAPWSAAESNPIERLHGRGFVTKRANATFAITLKGHIALLVRRYVR
jgi:hypothetical protein